MQFPAKRWIRPDARRRVPQTAPAGHLSGRVSTVVAVDLSDSGACEGAGDGAGDGAWGASLLDQLLHARGVVDADARAAFFQPTLKQLQHPWDLHDMTKAVNALHAAITAGKRVAIYGDYDVDGVMATTILWHALRAVRADAAIRTYIPHRRKEGYGLNADAIHRLADEGVELIVTVDCGVSAVDEAAIAAERGVELVLTDHHNLRADGAVPSALAVVHPRVGNTHAFGDLCGAAVAWKFAWALFYEAAGCSREGRLPEKFRNALLRLLPLAAVGTIADVMPLLGENRAIVAEGLPWIKRTDIEGFDGLLKRTRVVAPSSTTPIDAETIAFRFAPGINAAGRMQHAEDAVELFTTARGARVDELVRVLAELNEQRKVDSAAIHLAARENWLSRICSASTSTNPEAAIVLWDDHWNLGIVGIVCSKLVDEFARPTILLTRDVHEGSEYFKGSGRSVAGIDMHAALSRCAHTLVSYGGHAMAAGIKVHESRLDEFRIAFCDAVRSMLPHDSEPRPELVIDAVARVDAFELSAIQTIDRLQPFGRGNPRPLVLVEDLEVTQVRPLGRDGKHLELVTRVELHGQLRHLTAKWWRSAEYQKFVQVGARIDLVVEPSVSQFRGIAEVSLTVVDLEIRSSRAKKPTLEK